jgi:hypothetical protein
MYDRYYQSKKDAAYLIYTERPLIYSPFFKEAVLLSSEGFRHLIVSTQGERSREEQVERFMALPLGIDILETATVAQNYRRRLAAVRTSSPRSKKRKLVHWWSFRKYFVQQAVTVTIVVRKVGNGKLHFWSVMAHTNGVGEGTPRVPRRNFHEIRPGGPSHIPVTNDANAPTIPG